MDTGDVLAEDAEEGIGLFGIRLYCFGVTRFKFQLGTGNALAKAQRLRDRLIRLLNLLLRLYQNHITGKESANSILYIEILTR